LTRFVTGHEEALQQYRDSGGERLPEGGEAPPNDPWEEDPFHRPQPSQPPAGGGDEDEPMEDGPPEAVLPGPDQDPLQEDRAFCPGFWDSGFDPSPLFPSKAAAGDAAKFEAVAALLAGLLVAQAQGLSDEQTMTGQRLTSRPRPAPGAAGPAA
jgi:hypothetical protein